MIFDEDENLLCCCYVTKISIQLVKGSELVGSIQLFVGRAVDSKARWRVGVREFVD